MIIYVETDAEELIKESEAKLEEVDENEPKTIATINVTKTSYCVQLTNTFYGHKLRDFGNNKIKLRQNIDNVKMWIEEERFAL